MQSPKPEAEKTALRKSLAAINADVLLIDEMGDAAFLRELRDDLAKFEGLVYEYTATTRYDSPSRVAIMSRIKPEKFVDCCDIKFEFKGDQPLFAARYARRVLRCPRRKMVRVRRPPEKSARGEEVGRKIHAVPLCGA